MVGKCKPDKFQQNSAITCNKSVNMQSHAAKLFHFLVSRHSPNNVRHMTNRGVLSVQDEVKLSFGK